MPGPAVPSAAGRPPQRSEPLFLMGHSLGAATALALVADIPLAGLILCGTPAAVFDGRPPRSARGAGDAPHPRSVRGAGVMPYAGHGVRPADAGVAGRGAVPLLPEGLPVLVVHGVDDRRAPIDRVRGWARTASVDFRAYPDAGHDLLHEPVHTEVTADIAEWVSVHCGTG
ncbi:alpha/beta hydrolase [Nocardia otitidiscaviarum]|uniref:alpha/beta hydrolase n=1 Tax=Nocardia otitidiscaviarum TaxID=1823 RepID=UPI002B4AFD74|nr:hypothetical protein [Nocardia otitidiscaviarum]